MGALEREVRPFMVEGLLRDRRDIFRAAFVFCMAAFTLALFLESPMQSLLLLDILSCVPVTFETQNRLCGFVESLMAFGAGLFPLGMSFDHLSRH